MKNLRNRRFFENSTLQQNVYYFVLKLLLFILFSIISVVKAVSKFRIGELKNTKKKHKF